MASFEIFSSSCSNDFFALNAFSNCESFEFFSFKWFFYQMKYKYNLMKFLMGSKKALHSLDSSTLQSTSQCSCYKSALLIRPLFSSSRRPRLSARWWFHAIVRALLDVAAQAIATEIVCFQKLNHLLSKVSTYFMFIFTLSFSDSIDWASWTVSESFTFMSEFFCSKSILKWFKLFLYWYQRLF